MLNLLNRFSPFSSSSEKQSDDPDWKSLYEKEHQRAEELKYGEIQARGRANFYRAFHTSAREKLEAERRHSKELEKDLAKARKELASTQEELKASKEKIKELEAEVSKLRGSREKLSKGKFGKKSEKSDREPTGRKRGQQPGSKGHGRTRRDDLPETVEVLDLDEDDTTCPDCGQPYGCDGHEETSTFEIEVKAHKRTYRRKKYRRRCECKGVPARLVAPPPPRPIRNSPYGISILVTVLIFRFGQHLTYRRISAWFADNGFEISAGTLAGFAARLMPLFEMIWTRIREHLNDSPVCHSDETSWRVEFFATIKSNSRGWLWVRHTEDAVLFHIDARRSATAAQVLFEGVDGKRTKLVCDRYSAYNKLARLESLTLCFCWAHVRRDWIDCASGHSHLEGWADDWVIQIGAIWTLNDQRLLHHDPDVSEQTEAYEEANHALRDHVEGLFERASDEIKELSASDRQYKPLNSLLTHRKGLCEFLDDPRVPPDNNSAERLLRKPVISRRISFGSDSKEGARFTSVMLSVFETLRLNNIPLRTWLHQWLACCGSRGREPPEDLSPWLPWLMSEERKQELREAEHGWSD